MATIFGTRSSASFGALPVVCVALPVGVVTGASGSGTAAWLGASSAAGLCYAGIGWRLHVRMGEAAEEIVALAEELGSRGIALGSRGMTATESLMLGSVAYKVVHHARVPVLIVR